MKKALRLLPILLIVGCAPKVKVNYLAFDTSVTYLSTDTVQVFWEKPNRDFIVIGLLSTTATKANEEKLLEVLRKKAMSVGAQGLILRPPMRESRVVGVPTQYGAPLITTIITYRLEGLAIRFEK
jgi:hypothetical protein